MLGVMKGSVTNRRSRVEEAGGRKRVKVQHEEDSLEIEHHHLHLYIMLWDRFVSLFYDAL